MATITEAITALDKLLEEANKFSSEYRSPIFEEKLRPWTKRGYAQLQEWGLDEEAQRFNGARGDYQLGDRQSYRYSTLTARKTILEALREDFTKHPEFYTQKKQPIHPGYGQPATIVPVRHDKVFLGHGGSLLWSKVERWLDKDKGISVQAWETQSHTGEHVTAVLQSLLDSSMFAVLVVTGEDSTANGTVRARQNVVHEIGLFQGKLGFKKVALLEQEATESFSNIDGLQTIRFPNQRIEATFPELERMMKREGILK